MRSFLDPPRVAAAFTCLAFTTSALAGEIAPPPAFIATGGTTMVSDYRFRGISQTDRRPAVQGTLGVSHASGFYAGAWGSSIDDHVAAGGDQEIDVYGGYRHGWRGWTLDAGLLRYFYPGHAPGVATDFFEPYLNASRAFGPLGIKLGLNYAWKQHALRCDYDWRCRAHVRADNLYSYGEVSAAIPGTGLTVTGHLGETWGRSYLTNGLSHYSDWSLAAGYGWPRLTLGIAYVDTDVRGGALVSPGGRQLGAAGVVGSIGVSF